MEWKWIVLLGLLTSGLLSFLLLYWFWSRALTNSTTARVPMRHRFSPEFAPDPDRSEAMALQILGDQAAANEEPGTVAIAPAPGESGYEQPHGVIHVVVGRWTILLGRGYAPLVSEAYLDGTAGAYVEPPYDMHGLVADLAFEVARLRADNDNEA